MADLIYGTNIGCVAQRSAPGGTPGQCGGREEFAVSHLYTYPRREQVRLFVCEFHARTEPTAEPLNADDHATIAGRRARRAAQMARVTVGPHASNRRT